LIIELDPKHLVIDERARDGTWCMLPYPRHPRGCPNFFDKVRCPPLAPKLEDIIEPPYKIVLFRFDLKAHAEELKKKPRKDGKPWTEAQARSVLYWQQHKVRKPLRKEAYANCGEVEMVLEIPEANGMNVYATMANIGIRLRSNPDIVQKVMLIGKRKT